VIEIVSAQLSGHIPASDRDILSGDVAFFVENIDVIAQAISEQLDKVAGLLCRIAEPLCKFRAL
jgi:hypothetical protein